MFWLRDPRPSFTHVSTHQTYVGKALFEHAPDCATIAVVACMSSSLLKSSLGPNLLALIQVDPNTIDLLVKIFLEFNPHMQLTQKLILSEYVDPDVVTAFISKLKSSGPLFTSSLLQAEIHSKCLLMLCGFRSLRSLTLFNIKKCQPLSVLKSLPSLSELKLFDCRYFDAAFFEAFGDLENNRNFTSLDISDCGIYSWCSEGFQKDFCGRLLSKNRLTKFKLPSGFWDRMNEEDEEAFVNAGMTNLVDLRGVSAKWIHGDGFRNLKILSVRVASDEELVNVGNHCLLLEGLEMDALVTGSFLNDENLVVEAFKHLRELKLDQEAFSEIGAGFSRFLSLTHVSIKGCVQFDGTYLQHLPNPGRLRSVFISGVKFSIRNLLRFVNLTGLSLRDIQLSREDILSLAVFKQLKRINLSYCGGQVATSEPFRILAQLPNLEKLDFFGTETSRWTEEDVEAILNECKNLRILRFDFNGDDQKVSFLEKRYPWVNTSGQLQKETTTEQESGSRREREEDI